MTINIFFNNNIFSSFLFDTFGSRLHEECGRIVNFFIHTVNDKAMYFYPKDI